LGSWWIDASGGGYGRERREYRIFYGIHN
jgi:hypothetical protein